ncbi:MAG TPA: FAD-dependent monooxygenase [candidate division Zixibacteria bacterium]|nr:FAD-dependent monooxygenase [candidate division Zixibacteria bacterium]
MINTPVLICGGGPVGLTLALTLSRHGIRSIVVNDRTETTSHPKLDVVNCRSMEIYRQLGLAEKIRDAGNPRTANQYVSFAASASGPWYGVLSDRHMIYQPVAKADKMIRGCTDGSLPLESMQRIAQMHLEPILLAEAKSDPNIDVRFGWFLYGFEQDETGVTSQIDELATGRHVQVRSEYLIGCDGPNSRVRNFLNIDYDGTRDIIGELFIIHLRSNEIATLYPNREPYWHTWISRPGFQGLLVSPDAGRNDFVLHRTFAPREGENLNAIVDAALGRKLSYEILRSGPWRPQFRVAQSFGYKRVYLAGDATHQYMPTGGLGMNTGISEAHNLAWKLAAVIKGWGGRQLIDSYEAERLPVARRNREHVKKCAAAAFEIYFPVTDDALANTPTGAAKRAELASIFEQKISRLYESFGIEIGYVYDSSPIVISDGERPRQDNETRYTPTAAPGSRLPSAFLADGTALFDHLSTTGFTLIVCRGNDGTDRFAKAAADRGVPLKVLPLAEPEFRKLYERQYLLVRPDQHVCWRSDKLPSDAGEILDHACGVEALVCA